MIFAFFRNRFATESLGQLKIEIAKYFKRKDKDTEAIIKAQLLCQWCEKVLEVWQLSQKPAYELVISLTITCKRWFDWNLYD